MTNDEKANAVALSLQTVMGIVSGLYDRLVGAGQHNIAAGVATLQSLLARWNAGVPDRLPGEVTAGDLAPARHLLAELERCLNEDARGLPHLDKRLSTQNARDNLLAYIGEQVAKASRNGGTA